VPELAGFSFYAAPEIEYFYFRSLANRASRRSRSRRGIVLRAHSGGPDDTDLRKRTIPCSTLEDMGIPVEYAQHEDAPSQHEIDLATPTP